MSSESAGVESTSQVGGGGDGQDTGGNVELDSLPGKHRVTALPFQMRMYFEPPQGENDEPRRALNGRTLRGTGLGRQPPGDRGCIIGEA